MKNALFVLCTVLLLAVPAVVQAAYMETLAEFDFSDAAGSATLTDISGNGNDGEVTTGAVDFSGGIGTFDGGDVITIDNAAGMLDVPNGRAFRITIELVDVPDISNTYRGIIGNRQVDSDGFQFYHWGWPANCFLFNPGAQPPANWIDVFTPQDTYAAGDNVTLIAEYTVDAMQLTYSVNGGASSTAVTPMTDTLDYEAQPSGTDWTIGVRGPEGGGGKYVGGIDYIKVEAAKVMLAATVNDLGTMLEGDSSSFGVVLTQAPPVDVLVTVDNPDSVSPGEAGDPNDLILNGSQDDIVLTFTPANWDTPQTITVEANDDDAEEAIEEALSIAFSLALTDPNSDPNYHGGFALPVAVTVIDNDGAGYVIEPADEQETVVAEGGVGGNPESDTVTIRLTGQPSEDVTLTLTEEPFTTPGTDPNDVVISPTTLTFTPANFDTPQTVTFTAVQDDIVEGDVTDLPGIDHRAGIDFVFGGAVEYTALNNGADAYELAVLVLEDECGPAGYLAADLNTDCEVTIEDLVILATNFLECTFPNLTGCP